jgi:diguanylate cyclase (GGDEF)-like protein/PAS domain S-box-containing protein
MSLPLKPAQPDHILIVDDQPENLKVLTQMLSQEGYKLRKAIGGEMALTSAFSKPPNLVLLDIRMPGMDGYEVCQKLKENPRTSEIPIIFISALDEPLNKVRALEIGGSDYITKPFQIQEVVARVRLQLRLQNQNKQLAEKNLQLRQEIAVREEVERHLRILERAISACRNGVIIADATQSENPIIYVNPAFERITGYSRSEVVGKNCRFLQGNDRGQPNLDIVRKALKNNDNCWVELRNYKKDGTLFWNDVSISSVRNSEGIVTHYIGIQTDITDRKNMEEALKASEAKFASAFRSSPDPIAISTLEDGRYLDINESFCSLMQYSREEAIGKTSADLNIWADPENRLLYNQGLIRSGYIRDKELQFRTKNGEIKTMLVSAELIEFWGQTCVLTVGKDITERQKIQAALEEANRQLQHLVNVDGLTQVGNRRSFDERLYQEWCRASRERQPLSLILCDVDDFKAYNDCYGHQRGDNCLIQVAKAIREALKRPADFVARYGGEEFVVVLPNTDIDGGVEVAERIRTRIRHLQIPHEKSRVSQFVTLSMGLASQVPNCCATAVETFVNAADRALYRAKQNGRDRIEIGTVNFSGDMAL